MHCKVVALCLPSELIMNEGDDEVGAPWRSILNWSEISHFMKNYNTCLDVRVATNKFYRPIAELENYHKAFAIPLVDLTDSPCRILPDAIVIYTWTYGITTYKADDGGTTPGARLN